MTTPSFLDLRIADRVDDRGSIMRIDLVRDDGGDLPAFTAGAHVEVEIPVEGASTPIRRHYSLWGDPSDGSRWRLGILDDPASRGGSRALHTVARPGNRLKVGLPANHFPLADTGPALLVGGGIGITPMLAMAHALHAAGRDFELRYCTRSADRTAFLDLLPGLPFAHRVTLHHDDGAASGPLVPARDLPPAEAGVHLYVCGPTGFMDWIIAAARDAGWPEDRIHREYFGAVVDTSGRDFEVTAKRSGVTVTVAEGQSIAAALTEAGVIVTLSCEEGVCGTCLCDVLEGDPDHRDQFLTDAEKAAGDQMLICCSRARSPRLVLDL